MWLSFKMILSSGILAGTRVLFVHCPRQEMHNPRVTQAFFNAAQ